MSATAVSTAVLQVMPYLINPGNANLGGKITFVFFGLSVPMCVYLYFYFPEMKGRTYLELEEMFQARLPARQFKTHVCAENLRLEQVLAGRESVTDNIEIEKIKHAVTETEMVNREENV